MAANLVDDGDIPRWEYEVFVSFRGEDVRDSFLSHLYKAFDDEWIEYFRDDDQREIGVEIASKLLHGIRHSKVAIVLFSSRYAESRWCLNELVEILDFHEKHKNNGHVFMPVFFKVRAGELRKQTGTFGKFFEQAMVKCLDDWLEGKLDPNLIVKWKAALKEAGNTTGWRLNTNNGGEAELIENIVEHLVCNILHKNSPYLPYPVVPVISQEEKLTSLLTTAREDDVCLVGIHGKRGIGKTTLAALVCKRLRDKFQGFSFLQLDDEPDTQRLIQLQKKLIIDVLKVKHLQMVDLRTNVNEIKQRLRGKKLLLVIDNISLEGQAKHFGVGDGKWFSPGTRILITTRHQRLLKQLRVDREYEVEKLGQEESCQLFCGLVFQSNVPKEGYEELSRSIVSYGDGNPAAIENLASEFATPNIDQWRKKLANPRDLISIARSNSIPAANKLNSDRFENQYHKHAGQVPSMFKTNQDVMTNHHQQGLLTPPISQVTQTGRSYTIVVSFEEKVETLPDVSDLPVNQIKKEPVADPVPPTSNNAKETIKAPPKIQELLFTQKLRESKDQLKQETAPTFQAKKETDAPVLEQVWKSIQVPFYEESKNDAVPQFQEITELSKEGDASLGEAKETRDQAAADLLQMQELRTTGVEDASRDPACYDFNLVKKGNGEATKEFHDPLLEEIQKASPDMPRLPSEGVREEQVNESCVRSANDVSTVEAQKEALSQVIQKRPPFAMIPTGEALEDIPHFSPNNIKKNMSKGNGTKEGDSPFPEELQKYGHRSSTKATLVELLMQAPTNEAPLDMTASNRNEITKGLFRDSFPESTNETKHAQAVGAPNNTNVPLSKEIEQYEDQCSFTATSKSMDSTLQSAINPKDSHTSKGEVATPFHDKLANSKDQHFQESTSVQQISNSDYTVNYKPNQKFKNTEEVERLVARFTETSERNRNDLLEITSRVDKILQGIPENFAELQDFDTLSDLLKALHVSSLPPEITLACGSIGSRLQFYKKLLPGAETKEKMMQLQRTIDEESVRISTTTVSGIRQQQSIQMLKERRANLEDREQEIMQQIKLLQEESRQIKEERTSLTEKISVASGLAQETTIQRSASEDKYRSDSKELFDLQNLFAEYESSLAELKRIIHQARSILQS